MHDFRQQQRGLILGSAVHVLSACGYGRLAQYVVVYTSYLSYMLLFAGPTTGLPAGKCEADSDCSSQPGQVCDQSSTQTACTCQFGFDSCKQLGICIPFCSSAKAKKKLETANAQVVVCDPFLPNTCSGGLVCQASSAGVQLVCKDGEGFIPVEVGGVCVPAKRELLSARFSSDGKQLTLTLNAAARSAEFGCSSLFNSTVLGDRPWCAAADRVLTVDLDSSAKLMPGDRLDLLADQSLLVDKLQSDVAFKGGAVVESCTECSAPMAKVKGPQVRAVM
jgi:hypothetical protein